MGQSSLDYSWDCTQFYMAIEPDKSFSDDYTEVEYLEATGSQYLDSNYIPNINTIIKGKYLHSENSADTPLFGSRTLSMTNSYTFWAHPSDHTITSYKSQMIFNNVAKTFSDGNLPHGQINAFYYSKSLFRLNGVEMSVSTNSGSPELSLIIFGLRSGSAIDSRKFIGRIYEFNISENGTAVRDFVPCIRNSDNKPGMLDLVNNVFYANAGTGEFQRGPLRTVPKIYQRVEYIQNTGQQHIDTLVNGNNVNLKICTEYEPTNSGQMAIFSARTSDSNGISFWTDGYCHFGNSSKRVPGVSSTGKHKVELSKNGLYLDGTKLNFTTGTSMANANLILFRVLNDNRVFLGKIYSTKVYDNNILIRDLVPCYRKSDNVIGMFDLVNNVFYMNAGSGTFLKGNNASNNNYIKYKPKDADGYDVHFIN